MLKYPPATTSALVLGDGFVANVISTAATTLDPLLYNHFQATEGSDIVFSIRGDGQVRLGV